MQCPNCKALNDKGAMFCGNCGKQLAPLYSRGSAATEISQGTFQAPQQTMQGGQPQTSASSMPPSPTPHSIGPMTPSEMRPYTYEQATPGATTVSSQPGQRPVYDATTMAATAGGTPVLSHPPTGRRSPSRTTTFLLILTALCLVVVAVGVFSIIQGGWANPSSDPTTQVPGNAGPKGRVELTDTPGNPGSNNHIKISISELEFPSSGTHYTAWMFDEPNERYFRLGDLKGESENGASVLKLDATLDTNLLGKGNQLIVTQETGNSSRPQGTEVLLVGMIPKEAYAHVQHILFKFPTTAGESGLLIGTLKQTTLLHEQAELLKKNRTNKNAVQCIARNMNHLINGKNTPDGHPLPGNCTSAKIAAVGDGQGLLGENGYVAMAADHATLAGQSKDANDSEFLDPNYKHVNIAMENLTELLGQIKQDVEALLKNPGDTAKINAIASLTDAALNGTDANGNGKIEPINGESGAKQGYTSGQLMTQMNLVKK